jgi:hypothetical protein
MSTVAEPITADEMSRMPHGEVRRELIRYVANRTISIFAVGETLDDGDALPGFQCPVSEIFRIGRRGG